MPGSPPLPTGEERWGLSPVGRLFEIVHGDQRAVITEAGASLRAYEVGGRPVLEPFDGLDTAPVGCQGEILAPWPNRTVDGAWTWDGTRHQLWITEPEQGHALHGLVRTLAWTPVEAKPHRIEMETTLLAHPGWPFPLHFAVSYAVGPDGLTSRLSATNVGRTPCPYGAATHPYLAVPGGTVDDAVLRIGAATWLATDDRLAPIERHATAGTPYEFGGGHTVGGRRADNALTDLERGSDGRVEATATAPDGHTTVVWGDSSVRWWQLFTGDALPGRWQRRALALEPMTCGPDSLNTGDDLVVLEPGDGHDLTWGLRLD